MGGHLPQMPHTGSAIGLVHFNSGRTFSGALFKEKGFGIILVLKNAKHTKAKSFLLQETVAQ